MKKLLLALSLISMNAVAQTISVGQALTYLNSGIQARLDWEGVHANSLTAHPLLVSGKVNTNDFIVATNSLTVAITNEASLRASGDSAGSNYVGGVSSGLTNYANSVGASVALAGTNYANGVARSSSNYTDSVASGLTNYVNGVASSGSNYTASVASGKVNNNNGVATNLTIVGDAVVNSNLYVTGSIAVTNTVSANNLIGNGASVSNVNAKLFEGYTIDEVMAVGATYYFSTNIISYGAVTGRVASLTPPTESVTVTYGPNVTNGQYFASYLISSNEMPAVLHKGVYTFNFRGGHTTHENKNPTIMGDFYIKMVTNGVTIQEFESLPTVIPYGNTDFQILINITNDIPKDGFAFLLRTKLVNSDGYAGEYVSSFGPPTYSGFTFPKVNGLYVTKAEFDSAPRGATNVAVYGGSKLGTYDGVTRVLTLPELDSSDIKGGAVTNNQSVINLGAITATSFVRNGGILSEFLKADGSVDSNTYLTNHVTGITMNLQSPNNGFEKQYAQTISFNPAERTLTVTPTGTSFRVTAYGVSYTFTSPQTSSVAPLSGNMYFYFGEGGVLIGTNQAWTIGREAQVAYVKYNTNTLTSVISIDERHGVEIADAWHRQQHFTIGTKKSSGLDLFHNASDNTTAPTATGINTCISIGDGSLYDEDVYHVTVTNGVQNSSLITTNNSGVFPILYSDTVGNWIKTNGTAFPFLWSGNIPQTVSNGIFSSVAEDRYFVYWLVVFGSFDNTNAFLISHPSTYTSTALAQSGATPYSLGAVLGSLPSPEILVAYRIIFNFSAAGGGGQSYSTAIKSTKIRDVTDFRYLSSGVIVAGTPGASSAIVHNDTTGRDGADVHPMVSITGLTDALASKVDTNTFVQATNTLNDAITNEANLRVIGDVASTNGMTSIVYSNPASFYSSSNPNGYVTQTITNGLATTNFVTTQGYVTETITNGLVSTNAINIYQDISSVTTSAGITNTITVVPTVPIYKITATNLTTQILFDISNLDLTNHSATWETWITVATTNVSISLPSTNTVYYVVTPTLSTTVENQTLYGVWRAFVKGTTTNIFCNQWLSK